MIQKEVYYYISSFYFVYTSYSAIYMDILRKAFYTAV